ncbi:phosphatase PAP2 family protein [Aquibacillus rhizosphaerae]|uniref:Phosphatase PAP2 family protein n=1 Tax=Aquibacillus rhizosphaerae TaxID=3051431 RepID=A0ABT7L4L5_9BACI|nr:phosphatase PAP2 family protein [Aquibacillus sp. LR5S19]MDL4840125.1 phosphatase PAP2 family protein [Aquibacillus sp. LR5S19]
MNRFIGWLSMTDNRYFLVVNRQWKNPKLDYILPRITHLGGASFTLTSLFILLILLPNPYKILVLHALLALTISHLIVHLMKKLHCRKRPYLSLPNVNTFINPLKDYSFPSGHTTAAFSIAVSFSLHMPLCALILIPLAFLVALSRMYIGLHYPTDCLIGALIGTISSLVSFYIFPF